MTIPKRIHQIFLSGELPSRLASHVEDLKERNPSWEHTLYCNEDGERFISEHYDKEMLNVFNRINPAYGAARADLLRQLIIYKLGGIYLDIKSDAQRPFDQVLLQDDQYILSRWRNGPGQPEEGFGLHHQVSHIPGGEYPIHFLISVPGHPFTKAAIDRIVSNISNYRPWSGVGRNGVLKTSGPIAYSLAIDPIISKYPHRIVLLDDLGINVSPPNYNHEETFRQHYSKLMTPIARLSPIEVFLQRCVERLRLLKQKLID